MTNILTAILEAITSSVEGFGGVLKGAFEGVISIFFANGKLTEVGYLLVFAFAMSLVFLAFRMVKGLISQKGAR